MSPQTWIALPVFEGYSRFEMFSGTNPVSFFDSHSFIFVRLVFILDGVFIWVDVCIPAGNSFEYFSMD